MVGWLVAQTTGLLRIYDNSTRLLVCVPFQSWQKAPAVKVQLDDLAEIYVVDAIQWSLPTDYIHDVRRCIAPALFGRQQHQSHSHQPCWRFPLASSERERKKMYKRAGCGICRNIRQRSSALTYVWATGRSRSRFLFALRLVLSFGLYAMAGALDFLLFYIFFSWLVVRQRKKKFPGLTFSFAPVIHPPPASMAQYIWYLCINKVVFFIISLLIFALVDSLPLFSPTF